MDLKKILFLLVVLLANIIQGITGFAGTVLAMPPSVLLVGMDTAKPILNALGLLSGIWVAVTQRKHIKTKEFIKVTAVMAAGLFAGMFVRGFFEGQTRLMHIVLGAVVGMIGAVGLFHSFFPHKHDPDMQPHPRRSVSGGAYLVAAGVFHGLFVCGGPLMVAYLQGRLKDKNEFRATVSCVWIVLNSILLIDDLRLGHWNAGTLRLLPWSAAVLFAGMFLGGLLYRKMSREAFMKLTFALLIVSGISLFL
ncbi:MAG: sulfite exporter TauE/SafE family protein [Clostridia bacterium]|nr:sulfite exporter TauE/SafE family protein [Clostridia bacterium]